MRLLFVAALLLPALALAQPVPNNCTSPSAACQSRKFVLVTGNGLCLNGTPCTVSVKSTSSTGPIALTSPLGVTISGPAASADALAIPSGSFVDFGGGAQMGWNGFDVIVSKSFQADQFYAGQNTFNGSSGTSNIYYSFLGTGDGSSVAHIFRNDNTLGTNGAKIASFRSNNVEQAYVSRLGSFGGNFTDISAAPGSGTVNTPFGLAAFPSASAAAITITSAVSTTTSLCFPALQTVDATEKTVVCVPGNGSFTLTPGAATTGITKVAFEIRNGN